MQEIDVLLAVAQIGIAIAGFASIATVVGHAKQGTDPRVNSIRLRGLLDTSLSVMLLALVAIVFLETEKLSDRAWQLSSVVGLLTTAGLGRAIIKRSVSVRQLPGYNHSVAGVLYAIFGAVVVAFLVNSSGFLSELGYPIYLSALVLILTICCVWFVLVIISLLARLAEDPDNSSRE